MDMLHLKEEINAMLLKSDNDINLSMEDVREVLKSASRVMYLCEGISCHQNDLDNMRKNIYDIVDRLKILTSGARVNYLIHIDLDEKIDLDMVRFFMDNLYELCEDDATVIFGTNTIKRKDIHIEPEVCMVFKILIGVY